MSGKQVAADPADAGAPVRGDDRNLTSALRAAAPHAGVVALLLGLAIALTANVWVHGHPTSSVLCTCGDPGQTVWFLEWVPWAIAHGHNPLLTETILAGQGGANLLQSTSYLLQSFVLAPVTWMFGPTASLNVAELLAPVVSGWCMFVAARRVTTSWVGQAGAAVLWGFSPVVINAEHFGHLNYDFLFFPPLVFICVFDLVARDRRSPQWIGLWLGLLVAAQFLAGTELLAITSIAAGVGVLAALAFSPARAWALRRRLGIGLGVAAVVAAVLVAYPAWMLLEGPRHVVGPPWPGLPFYGNLPSSVVNAGSVHALSSFSRVGGYYGPVGAAASFLGWPLLVFIAVSGFVWWRKRVAWVLVVIGLVAWMCSLGVLLLPLSAHSVQWWLPWRYAQNWPLVDGVAPNRFAVVDVGVAAMLFALSVDGWYGVARRLSGLPAAPEPIVDGARRHSRRSSGWVVAAVAAEVGLAGAIAVTAIPLVQSNVWPLTMESAPIPSWFLTTARHLPPTSSVLVYPYPSSAAPDAMYWQANDGMSFRLAGGRAQIPGADGRHSEHIDPLGGTVAYLTEVSSGSTTPAAPSTLQITQLRASLANWQINVVVVVAFGRAPAWATTVFTAALGRAPTWQNGAAAWYSPGATWQTTPPLAVSRSSINHCSRQAATTSGMQAASACLLRSPGG